MNENGNQYALAALRDRRAKIAGEVAFYKRKVSERKKQLAVLDSTIRLFDPEYRQGSIRPKRYRSSSPLFSQGELGRLILDTLREAKGEPLAVSVIATRAADKLGLPASAYTAVTSRVRANVAYLKRNGRVAKTGEKAAARWTLAGSPPA
jgi:hypothetical protein